MKDWRAPGRFLSLAILVLFSGIAALPAEDGELRVALIQFAITEGEVSSHDRFAAEVERLARQAVLRSGAELLVFPEYINVFPLFDNYTAAIASADGLPELEGIIADAGGIPELLREELRSDTAGIRTIWSELARSLNVWILAGTAFVEAADGTLRNRAWLFAPDGTLEYRQDKVFLTDFEARFLDLEQGKISRARPFEIEGVRFGLSICRDSYFDVWEERYAGVDVWLDIRANGERWTPVVQERFNDAMPERVEQTPVELGLSTSLNGSFLDLLWQGPAFVVNDDGERIRQSPVVDGDHIMIVAIPAGR